MPAQGRRLIAATCAAVLALSAQAWAGDVQSLAGEAETALSAGETEAALGHMDAAVDAFWADLPLSLRTATFVAPGSVRAFGKYQPVGNEFQQGGAVTVYLEPVGYGFSTGGEHVAIGILVGLEIRSPGGIVYARSPDFGRLAWHGRVRSREVHGEVAVALPDLKPGNYELVLNLTDKASGKTAEAVLPFVIVPATAPDEAG